MVKDIGNAIDLCCSNIHRKIIYRILSGAVLVIIVLLVLYFSEKEKPTPLKFIPSSSPVSSIEMEESGNVLTGTDPDIENFINSFEE